MKKNNIGSLILTGLVLVALAVGVVLVRQTQELRRGASFTTADLRLLPSDQIVVNVGDQVPVRVRFVAQTGKVVDAVQTTICQDGELTLDDVSGVVPSADFDANPIVSQKEIDGKNCYLIVFTATKPTAQLKNSADVGTVNFVASSPGQGNITVETSNSMVTGDNPGSLDKEVAIASAEGTTYLINDNGNGQTGTGPVLNFKVAFNGVLKANQCANNMKVKLTVKSGNESKVYSNVALTRTSATNSKGYSVYEGSTTLSGFKAHNSVAAFFKGSKHLQGKYSVNNQNKIYDKAGGQLVLTDSANTSTVYNFAEYPMLAGDVNQDGRIDAVDFSLEKNKIQTHKTVAESDADAIYDLDGSCQLNTLDITILVKSLDEKQEEIY